MSWAVLANVPEGVHQQGAKAEEPSTSGSTHARPHLKPCSPETASYTIPCPLQTGLCRDDGTSVMRTSLWCCPSKSADAKLPDSSISVIHLVLNSLICSFMCGLRVIEANQFIQWIFCVFFLYSRSNRCNPDTVPELTTSAVLSGRKVSEVSLVTQLMTGANGGGWDTSFHLKGAVVIDLHG